MERDKEGSLKYERNSSKEYENPFKKWRVWLFYGVVSFALIWLLYYYLYYLGGTSPENSERKVTKTTRLSQTQETAVPKQENTSLSGQESHEVRDTSSNTATGKSIFQANCAACHGLIGEGGIGPNLTDNYWLHGNTEQNMINVVRNGIPDKGMASWKSVLDSKQIRDVVTYILTLQGSNPPNAKAPQGVKY